MDDRILSHLQKMDQDSQTLLRPFLTEPSEDAWVRDVLLSYFSYFMGIDEKGETAAKGTLRAALKPLVQVGTRRSLDKMEDFLHEEFLRKGFQFLGGMTGPYYGPYIWKRTEKRAVDVELPGRQIKVNVFFMHDFLMCSWMHFQTFGKSGTGGWVKRADPPWEDGLYCVASDYDLDHLETDLTFQVSLLKHEGQHFTDKIDFPNMTSTDLEYRAKLVELINYPEMKYRFVEIVREAEPNKKDPHQYASHRILQELSRMIVDLPYLKDENLWAAVPYEKIQREAIVLLQEHTKHLKRM
jgi:hypothetical protein